MKHKAFAAALVLTAPLYLATPSFAQEALPTERFVEQVSLSDMFEVEAGQVADDTARLPAIKAFGQRMVDDHTKTSAQLKSLVADNAIKAKLPSGLDDKQQAELDKLKKVSDKEFDKTYIEGQVKAHQKAVETFQAYSKSGDNTGLKEWAQNTLPALKDHLEEALTLQKEVDKAPVMAANENAAANRSNENAARENADTADADSHDKPAHKSSINYVTRQAPTDWSAQALIGRNVMNPNGEALGDINNVILNEKGDVIAVTIGVGGFLGIGEKDVGVPFKNLDFRTAEVSANRDTSASKEERAEEKQERAEDAREARYDSEHENMEIVLKATREELEKAPSFVWLDQQNSTGKRTERSAD